MSGQRFRHRHTTILSVDAVGYSTLMGFDQERAFAALERRRRIVAAHCEDRGGVLFGVVADSLMVDFGQPAEALLAAFDFLAEIDVLNADVVDSSEDVAMTFRAAANTGDILIDDGAELGLDQRAGDTVNVAARLQQELAHPGGLVVSESTWAHVEGQVAVRFEELGPKQLKHILVPVRAFRVHAENAGDKPARPSCPSDGGNKVQAGGLVDPDRHPERGVALVGQSASDTARANAPSVAVLPFRSLGPDSRHDYIADGLTSDVLMGLANTRWISVIAAGSSFQFRDMKLPPRAAAQALGARYVVSGTLAVLERPGGATATESNPRDENPGMQLRVDLTLEDADHGRVILHRRFEHPASAITTLQNEMGGQIAIILGSEMDRVEQLRTFELPWDSLQTWQHVRRGRWHLLRRSREDLDEACQWFQRALERDPDSPDALNELSWWHFWRGWLSFGRDPGAFEHFDESERLARQALQRDSQDARPYAYLGAVNIMRGELSEAIGLLEEARRINPSSVLAHVCLGSAHLYSDEPDRAVPMLQLAETLSPFDPYRFHNLGELASALRLNGQYEQALRVADASLTLSPGYWYSRLLKVAVLDALERPETADAEMQILRTLHPTLSERQVDALPFENPAITAALRDVLNAPRPKGRF